MKNISNLDIGNCLIINDDFLRADIGCEIDLIVTSPPYNLDIEYATYKDQLTYDQYLDWSYEWLHKAYNVSKDSGRLCLNVPLDTNLGGNKPITADLTKQAQRAGWSYRFTIIWNESNISRRTAWGSYLRASAPNIITPVESIIVMYKGEWKKEDERDPKLINDISPDEFKEWSLGLWTFNGERTSKFNHPAPFPEELPKRCIKMFSHIGDTILDPFLGSGTTLATTMHLNRKGVGTDISYEYCKTAFRRLEKIYNNNPNNHTDLFLMS